MQRQKADACSLEYASAFFYFLLPSYFPLSQTPLLGVKAHANLEYLPRVSLVRQGIALLFDLLQRLGGRLVQFEFEDIDKLLSLQYTISPPLAAPYLTLHELPQQSKEYIEHRLEIMLEGCIVGGVGNAGKKCGEDIPYALRVPLQEPEAQSVDILRGSSGSHTQPLHWGSPGYTVLWPCHNPLS